VCKTNQANLTCGVECSRYNPPKTGERLDKDETFLFEKHFEILLDKVFDVQ
jgi:hypothetical protein